MVHKIGPFRQMDQIHKGGSTLSTYPYSSFVTDFEQTFFDLLGRFYCTVHPRLSI